MELSLIKSFFDTILLTPNLKAKKIKDILEYIHLNHKSANRDKTNLSQIQQIKPKKQKHFLKIYNAKIKAF